MDKGKNTSRPHEEQVEKVVESLNAPSMRVYRDGTVNLDFIKPKMEVLMKEHERSEEAIQKKLRRMENNRKNYEWAHDSMFANISITMASNMVYYGPRAVPIACLITGIYYRNNMHLHTQNSDRVWTIWRTGLRTGYLAAGLFGVARGAECFCRVYRNGSSSHEYDDNYYASYSFLSGCAAGALLSIPIRKVMGITASKSVFRSKAGWTCLSAASCGLLFMFFDKYDSNRIAFSRGVE